jgi:hypothetical protein
MLQGSKPVDGGHFILSKDERDEMVRNFPQAIEWIRPIVGSNELIKGTERYCLWLKGISPQTLREIPPILQRVQSVREARLKSPTAEFRDSAATPTLFTQDRQPSSAYIAVPEVSSENRLYVPIAFLPATTIATNLLLTIEGGTAFHFAIITSALHMAWMRVVAGRLKSDYRYAPAVYNNFPWPTPSEAQRATIERTAQGILDARAAHPGASLADLYDPLAMPPNLVAAHATNDRAVDAAYGQPRGFPTEAARLAFLFDLYQSLVAPLDATPTRRRPRARRSQG